MDNLTFFAHRPRSLRRIASMVFVFCQQVPVYENCGTFQVLRDPLFLQTKIGTAVCDTMITALM